jgi:hypothetical protein
MQFLLGKVSPQRLEHRAKGGGKNGIEGHFPSHFQIISELPCVVDWNLDEQVGWALFSSFGLLGSVDGFWAILPMFGLPWITSIVGLWASGGSLGCWIWSVVD